MSEFNNINRQIAEIIPPNNYKHREGFSNKHLIDALNNQERAMIEEVLISMLLTKVDILIVETLGYMKSLKSVPILIDLLRQTSNAMNRLIISSTVFEINQDMTMIEISIEGFKTLNDEYFSIIHGFYYLSKFKNEKTEAIIKRYIQHSDYLISYNAKQALRMT
jgi:hypothetical protein